MKFRELRTRLVGRKVLCSRCNRRTVFGKIGIFNKVLFLFCSKCLEQDHAGCILQMRKVASIERAA